MIKQLKLFWIRWRNRNIYKYETSKEVLEVILRSSFPKCNSEITDESKMLCDKEMLKSLASLMPVKYLKYKSESFDCEDFAKVAWGSWTILFPRLAIGYCHVSTPQGSHAMNCAFCKENDSYSFVLIEPQTGELKEIYQGYIPYKVIL